MGDMFQRRPLRWRVKSITHKMNLGQLWMVNQRAVKFGSDAKEPKFHHPFLIFETMSDWGFMGLPATTNARNEYFCLAPCDCPNSDRTGYISFWPELIDSREFARRICVVNDTRFLECKEWLDKKWKNDWELRYV